MLASGIPTFPPASPSLWVFLRDAEAVGIRLASAERQLPSPAANVEDVVSDLAGDEGGVSIKQPCRFRMYRGENTNEKKSKNRNKSCSNSQRRSLKGLQRLSSSGSADAHVPIFH